jgi:hypothetical protein
MKRQSRRRTLGTGSGVDFTDPRSRRSRMEESSVLLAERTLKRHRDHVAQSCDRFLSARDLKARRLVV